MLSTSRPIAFGGGVGFIPLSEMAAYLDFIDTGVVRWRFMWWIKELDRVYVTLVNEKMKPKKTASTGKRKPRE